MDQQQLLTNSAKYFKNLDDAANKILDKNHKFALVTRVEYFYNVRRRMKISERDLCSVSSLQNAFATRMTEAMALRRGSPLRELLTHKYCTEIVCFRPLENPLQFDYSFVELLRYWKAAWLTVTS